MISSTDKKDDRFSVENHKRISLVGIASKFLAVTIARRLSVLAKGICVRTKLVSVPVRDILA